MILAAMYPRTVKVRSSNGTINEYVRVVEAYREDGKVKQRVVADLGRKDVSGPNAAQAPTLARGGRSRDAGDLPATSTSSMLRPGGQSSPSGPCSTNSASGRSSIESLRPAKDVLVRRPRVRARGQSADPSQQ